MNNKDLDAHNLDAYLDNLYTTLDGGYRDAMFDPQGEEEAMLSSLYTFLAERMVGGFVRVADKVRHN